MRPCGMARPGVGLSGRRCAAERRREARLWPPHQEVSSTSLGERSDSDSGSLSPPPDPPGLSSPSSTSHAVFLLVMCSRSCSRPKTRAVRRRGLALRAALAAGCSCSGRIGTSAAGERSHDATAFSPGLQTCQEGAPTALSARSVGLVPPARCNRLSPPPIELSVTASCPYGCSRPTRFGQLRESCRSVRESLPRVGSLGGGFPTRAASSSLPHLRGAPKQLP